MSRTKYEIIEVNNIEVTVDLSMLVKTDDMFFNATEIAKQFDKLPKDFLRTEQTKEYIQALIELKSGKDNSPTQEYDLVRTKRGGKYQGTWMHQDLALQFARWLSPKFSVKLDSWVKVRLKEEESRRKNRLASKTGYLELSEAVQNDHDPVKAYHFSNEANLINKIVLGMSAKKYKAAHGVENVRDNVDSFQGKAIDELQKLETSLIKLGVDYQERKDKLTKFYQEKIMLPA